MENREEEIAGLVEAVTKMIAEMIQNMHDSDIWHKDQAGSLISDGIQGSRLRSQTVFYAVLSKRLANAPWEEISDIYEGAGYTPPF